MQNWKQLFLRNTGLSPYVWVVFYILPFYFIFRATSTLQIVIGVTMIVGFFICYVLSFLSKGWLVYFWTAIQIVISAAMVYFFSYIYFFLFPAYFIGNLRGRTSFFSLYPVLLVMAYATVNYEFATRDPIMINQLPFVFLCLIAVTLIPVSTYNKNKEEKLQGQLEDANKRIAELVKLEERQRIARDLHDTLGQQLSLIGLKSELASKLIKTDPEKAQAELNDVNHTARIALQEVRELVTQMRGTRLEDELQRSKQILEAAGIEIEINGDTKLTMTSLLSENVICMCMREAVTNIVKHSEATRCMITIEEKKSGITLKVQDNGKGLPPTGKSDNGNGIRGMKERIEFVNGTLAIYSNNGTTTVLIKVPSVTKPMAEEGSI